MTKLRKLSVIAQAVAIVVGCMTVSCKGRSGQTIEVSPTPPVVPNPGSNSTRPGSANFPTSKDPFGTSTNGDPDFNNSPVGSPPSSSGNGSANGSVNSTTGTPSAPASPPAPPPAPAPAPPVLPSNLSNCDRYNEAHFGGGFGSPFLSNGVWLGYQDSQRTVLCLLAIPKCSSSGYGDKFCKGPLTLAKDEQPTASDPKDKSQCVVDYTPSATCPGT